MVRDGLAAGTSRSAYQQRASIVASVKANKRSPEALRARCCGLLAGHADGGAEAALWEHAWREGVGACLWHALEGRIALDADVFDTHVRQPLRVQTTQALRQRRALGELLAAMSERDIPCFVLRGASLAETLYDRPALRPQTDIDLLVAGADLAAAASAAGDIGFRALPEHPQLLLRADGALLDLHADPLDMDRIRAWSHLTPLRTEDFFAEAREGRLANAPALLAPDELLMPYLCFHAMKHSFERLIWLWDIALLARRIEARGDWDAVLAGARRWRLERPCYYALAYAAHHLDAPVPDPVLAELAPRMDWRERALFARVMAHEVVPFLAERLFARMMPDARTRLAFWRETIVPRESVRRQIADGEGCARCQFIRKRLAQGWRLLRTLGREVAGWGRAAIRRV